MNDPRLSGEALATIAAELASGPAVADVSIATGQPREFVRLAATTSYDVWLIAWEPDSALEMHDHGGSVGAIYVVRGTLAESYRDRGSRGRSRRRQLHAGANVVVPARRIHAVRNPGQERALSVHVYSPPLTAMTFYEHSGHVRALEFARD